MTEAAPWVDLATYAERTGQRLDAVRSAVRRGRLRGRKGNDGRWLLQLPEAGSVIDLAGELGIDDELIEARAEIERWRQAAEERGLALARLEGELDAFKATLTADLGAKEEVLVEVRRTLEIERARGDRLADELRDRRQPWWRKLISS